MQSVDVFRIPMRGPGDVTGLAELLARGTVRADEIVAILGKTEGTGLVNDFTREYAVETVSALLADAMHASRTDISRRIAIVMSGGTEGVLSPHMTVFARRWTSKAAPEGKRLAVGIGSTRELQPHEVGRMAQIQATAEAVRAAIADAGIDNPADVHFVQVKCPLLRVADIESARSLGEKPVTLETRESMAWSRGASALGVAIALGELPDEAVRERDVLAARTMYSSVASCSAGNEQKHVSVIVFGMSAASASDYGISHRAMRDLIDADAVRGALADLGVPEADAPKRVINVLAKCEADPTGHVRGVRHTMLSDADLDATRHARAAAGAVIASVVGVTTLYVSGGAEHQGPPGGGPVAVIAKLG
ncbi:ring-opening amidohydrolase [Derxia gummosa]|uniref:Cyanuric acid amidohydrolase n=1 Tax=Derxia gummosa DSM 723 TaxID=1121388 RepID=A0A8B6X587_9BURK|nr:ring-opening amidohydrolase [Derxia gummosa]